MDLEDQAGQGGRPGGGHEEVVPSLGLVRGHPGMPVAPGTRTFSTWSPYFASLVSPTPLTCPRGQGGRERGRDLAQGRVMEDHVGGHALLLRGGGAPGAELLEDRPGRFWQSAAACGRRVRCGGPWRGGPHARARAAAGPGAVCGAPRRSVGEHQRAVVALDRQQALRQQLAHHPAPLGLAQLRADPNTVRDAWPCWVIFGVFLPSRMSMTWPAPNLWCRSRWSRNTADSSFCAAIVPSQDSGGARHVSQLPHAPLPSPK